MNLDAAASFLQIISPNEQEFHFAHFDDHKDRKNKALTGERYGTLQQWRGHLDKAEKAGCGVFFTVQRTDGRGRKASNIAEYRLIFAEWDNKGVPLPDWPILPHAVVESSPGKFHVYWRVSGLCADTFKSIMARMVAMGSDPAAKDAARVLRLPGTLHQKDPAAPFMVRLVENFDAPPYPVDEMLKAFPPVEQPKQPPPSKQPHPQGQQGAILSDLRDALAFLSSDAYADWIAVGLALKTLGDEGIDLWLEWSATSDKFDAQGALDKWASFSPTATGYQSIFAKARLAGWKNRSYAAAMNASAEFHHPPMAEASGGDVVSFDAEKNKRKKGRRQEDIKDPDGLLVDKFGKPISCASNCKRWIARTGRKLEKNDFTNELSIDRKPMSDAAIVKLLIDLQQSTSVNIRKEHLMDGIIALCDDNHYHPVREYLESCQWDGTERLDIMLDMVFGHQGQPYSNIMGRYWMISAVARIMGPGAKADYSLLLIGHKEGTGKSSFGEALVPDLKWFTDDVGGDLHSREAETGLFGKWIVEFAEGIRGDRAGKDTFKGFLTRKTGRVTLKYERFAADFDRQCVFYTTTNNPTPLDGFDEDRRQWPVSVNVAVDNRWVRENRDQLWGEALARFRRGEQYWLDRGLIEKIKKEVHERYEHTDALMDLVAQYINSVPEPIFMGHIMESLKVSGDKPKSIQMRIANCLRALGFEKGKMIKTGTDRDKIPWERKG